MISKATNYDVRCMLCSAEVGQIWAGKFRQHAGCNRTMPRVRGMIRCCHCGGSLYLDPLDVVRASVDPVEVRKAMAEEAA